MPRRSSPAPAEPQSLADLTPDPRNARRHSARNRETLTAALQEVGAARSIVIDEAGVILAGNATVAAAAAAGLTRLQVVDADGETVVAVRRVGLTPAQKVRLALYDNRTAEFASWDPDMLTDLAEDDAGLLAGLFTDEDLRALEGLAGLSDPIADPPSASPAPPAPPPVAAPEDLSLVPEVLPRAAMGRPTKRTPELEADLVRLLASGVHVEAACELVGIHPSTFYEWKKDFPEFSDAVTRASARAEVAAVVAWRRAFNDDWRAARDFLRYRFPKRWTPTERLEHTGDPDSPVYLAPAAGAPARDPVDLTRLSDEQMATLEELYETARVKEDA